MEPPLWSEGASPWPHEREALAFVRAGLPDHEPYRAWTNVEFIADDGSVNEVDLLVVTPKGLFLVEIKSFPGVLTGDGQRWRVRFPSGHEKAYDHPLILANTKAKRLRSLLTRQRAFRDERVPWVTPLVFLSSSELDARMHDIGRVSVCGRDPVVAPGQSTPPPTAGFPPLPGIVAALKDPSTVNQRGTAVNRPMSRRIAEALDAAGLHPSNRGRRVGDWELGELLDEGVGWQDHLANRPRLGSNRRVRTYLAGMATSEEEQARLRRVAEREFRITHGLRSPGIAHPLDLVQADRGPSLLFDTVEGEARLDLWATDGVPALDLGERIELVRQLVEAVAHAHAHQVTHRALTARSVLARPGPAEGEPPQLVIGHWHAGAGELASRMTRHGGGDSELGTTLTDRLDDDELVYLAPEAFAAEHPDGTAMDVFSLGTLAHLLLTGRPPAANLLERERLLVEHGGLMAVLDADLPEDLLEFIAYATQPVPAERPSVEGLLANLDNALEFLTRPDVDDEPDDGLVDPLSAHKSDVLDGGWVVERRLGSGSTAVALLVTRSGERCVLKVARDEEHAERLRDEARALQSVRHAGIVELYGIERVGGRTTLRLALAGDLDDRAGMTLADRLRAYGRVGLDLLDRFGDDLLEALAYLESEGVPHRDIKPDNLGVRSRRGDSSLHLVLFDFSLARTPDTSLTAGTPGYLDPFLGERPGRRWDPAADRWAAAVTLYEMATATRPSWGDGSTDPLHLDDTLPDLDTELFDPSVREGLRSFFTRAFDRSPGGRFDTAEQMRRAWQTALATANRTVTSDDDRSADEAELDRLADAAAEDTPVGELGLSGRAVSALERLGTTSVRQLLDLPVAEWNRTPGVGVRTRREVIDSLARLRPRFDVEPIDGAASIDDLARSLVPRPTTEQTRTDGPALTLLLGLAGAEVTGGGLPAWPGLADLTARSELDRAGYEELLTRARGRWVKHPAVTAVRNELHTIVGRSGGVIAGDDLALALLAQRGSTATGDDRRARARAVVRAALETEAARDSNRFTWRRLAGGGAAVVALRADDLEGEQLADYAVSLGRVADQIAVSDPLATPEAALDQLRATPTPAGLPPLPDHRLVRLATATSAVAATSSRLEVYPAGLSPERALRLARVALLTSGVLSEEDVRQRIQARFPAAAPLPRRDELTRLLHDEVGLEWQPAGRDHLDRPLAEGYRMRPPPAPVQSTALTGSGARYRTGTAATVPDELRVRAENVDDRLRRHAARGGYLVLTVHPRFRQRSIDALSGLGASEASVDRLLIAALRRHADERRIRWYDAILAADAAGPDGPRWSRLLSVVRDVTPDIHRSLLTGPAHVLLTDAGLLARYGRLGLLDELREETTRAAPAADQTLRTLWVLAPAEDPDSLPTIDGQPVPVSTGVERLALPEPWLRNVHRTEPPGGTP